MNEEEIKKALEIIKQPITVNCIDYHYFDQENYDKLVAIFDNCRWFINNFEQLIDNFNDLQQENVRLKDKIEKAIELIKHIDKYEETLNDDTRVYMVQDVDVDEIERILKEN